MAVAVSSEWLNACSGCEISILNIGEVILDLIPEKIELVHIPALVDSKYFGPRGDGEKVSLPKATVGLVSGAVRTAEHERRMLAADIVRWKSRRHITLRPVS